MRKIDKLKKIEQLNKKLLGENIENEINEVGGYDSGELQHSHLNNTMEVIGDVIDVMISLRDRLNGLKFDITNDKMMSSVRTFVPQLDTILEKLADTYVEVSGEME